MKTLRTTPFLMANLGSEMQRFFAFLARNERDRAKMSADRALGIISDISIQDTGSAALEAFIFRDIIADALTSIPQYAISAEQLNSYFLPLARRVLAQ